MRIVNSTLFFVVTKPNARSEFADICFQTDLAGLRLQFLGGLKPEEIHAIYTKKIEAETAAHWLLDRRPAAAS